MGMARDILSILENLRTSGTSGPFSWASMGEAASLQKMPTFCLTLCRGTIIEVGQVSGLVVMALSASGFPQSLESLWGI